MAITIGILLVTACLSGGAPNQQLTSQVPTAAKADELFIVDCLLPGQIRRLGSGVTFISRRVPIKTSARDCQIRGGEYVAYDRANYATSLKIWLPQAEQGEPAAQTYVGEIFEKGLGVPPDHAAAAVWYQRAAEQGYSRAAINLGNLYEQGLGLPKDPKQALNWYRRAAGLPELKFEIDPESRSGEIGQLRDQVAGLQRELRDRQEKLDRTQRELDNLRRDLKQKRSEVDSERAALARRLQELEAQKHREQSSAIERAELAQSIKEHQTRLKAKDLELANLRLSVARLEAQSAAQRKEIDNLRKPAARPDQVGLSLPKKKFSFGNYHALVIGNNKYNFMRPLDTAVNDATVVGRLLQDQYGFTVKVLRDATRDEIVSALDKLRGELTDRDNLLIYYAGHGDLDRRNESGHWLPVNAHPDERTHWIPNMTISEILNVMTVKQLLVVADSCYAGTLTGSAAGWLELGKNVEENLTLLQVMARQRSRIVMTSGGVEPVIDKVGGQQHSLFAQGFIDLLRVNAGVLPGREMFRVLQRRVAVAAHQLEVRQIPEYAPIKFAGHESGDFLFVRANQLKLTK